MQTCYLDKSHDSDIAALRNRFVTGEESEPWDATDSSLRHVMDDEASGALAVMGQFDKMLGLGRDSFFSHVCPHTPRDPNTPPNQPGVSADGIRHQNEHWLFNAELWKKTISEMPAEHPVHDDENLLQEVYRTWNDILKGKGYVDGVDSYLEECERKKYVLVGSAVTQAAQGAGLNPSHPNNGPPGSNWIPFPNHVYYSPHVTQPADNPRSYVGTSLPVRLSEHRTKSDRSHLYGEGRKHGKRASACLIEGKFKFLLQRVGLTHRCTPDLASSILPLQIHTIYEVTFNGVGVGNATFEPVYMNYAMLP